MSRFNVRCFLAVSLAGLAIGGCSSSPGTDAGTDSSVPRDTPASNDQPNATDSPQSVSDIANTMDVADAASSPDATDAVAVSDVGADVSTTDTAPPSMDLGIDVAAIDTGPADTFAPPDAGCTMAPSAAPTLLAPWSTATATTRTPTLRWSLAGVAGGGAHVDVCADRACTTIQQSHDVSGNSVTLSPALSPGVHFWRVRTSAGTLFSPVWEFWTGAANAPMPSASGSTLDYNGDGFADVVVGAEGGGSVYLHPGSASGVATTATVLTGPAGSGGFGNAVASAGDVNGDGYGDLIVGAQASSTAWIYLGGSTGFGASPIMLSRPGAELFGVSVATAGDIDGDGYSDVVVGTVEGLAAYVYYGSPCGTGVTPTVLSAMGSGGIGGSLAGAMDLNGDGYSDLAVTGAIPGVYIYPGSASGLHAIPTVLAGPASAAGTTGISYFGNVVARAGDLNGDGYDDLAVGSAGEGGNPHVYVYFGGAAGVAAAPSITLAAPAGSNEFGAAIVGTGDLNGDGFADLVVGSFGSSVAYVYLGSATGLPATASTTLTGSAGSNFGGTLSQAGDLNADGYADLLVGADNVNTVYAYIGSTSGLSGTGMAIMGPTGFGFSFGSSIASVWELPLKGCSRRLLGS